LNWLKKVDELILANEQSDAATFYGLGRIICNMVKAGEYKRKTHAASWLAGEQAKKGRCFGQQYLEAAATAADKLSLVSIKKAIDFGMGRELLVRSAYFSQEVFNQCLEWRETAGNWLSVIEKYCQRKGSPRRKTEKKQILARRQALQSEIERHAKKEQVNHQGIDKFVRKANGEWDHDNLVNALCYLLGYGDFDKALDEARQRSGKWRIA